MSCDFYEFKSGLFCGDYYCKIKDGAVSSDTYYRYCRDYSYRDCPIYKHERNSSSGCFITTIACQILEKQDNDEILNNFRNFRNNILQPNQKYHNILKEYDVIGAMVANCIANDKDKEEMASGLYEHMLLPINDKISKKKYDEAVALYFLVTLRLVKYYGLLNYYYEVRNNDYNYENFEPNKAGHGLKKVKIKESK